MEIVLIVQAIGKALWNLKSAYDQHGENQKEIKELEVFIEDYNQFIPALKEHFKRGQGNHTGTVVVGKLEADIREAMKTLKKWSTNNHFLRRFHSGERMRQLVQLRTKLMASVQKNLRIASLSMLLGTQETQATLLESNVEMKNLLTTSIASTSGKVLQEVRAQVVEASRASFADEKFWADVLASVDKHNAGHSTDGDTATELYMDLLSQELMIDPVVASNGHTYCRWTIIDNITKDLHNSGDDLSIQVDNVLIRTMLLDKYPEQLKKFKQRRVDYRRNALLLASEGFRLADSVVALQHVLEWDKKAKKLLPHWYKPSKLFKIYRKRRSLKRLSDLLDLRALWQNMASMGCTNGILSRQDQ